MIKKMLGIVVLSAVLATPALAVRVMVQHEDSYELQLSNVLLPQSAAGRVIFRTCADCDRISMRVTPETHYVVHHKKTTLGDFVARVKHLKQARQARGVLVYLFYDIKSRRINRLVLDQ